MVQFTINGRPASSDAPNATPLLWVIREELKLSGTKFGCGAGMCGACMVHIDGKRAFSCQTQVSEVAGKAVTTIEGLSPDSSHPLQKAWLAEKVPQCGYCQSGQIMSAADLLKRNPHPSRDDIVEHMSAHICRCGTYPRIVRAIEGLGHDTNAREEQLRCLAPSIHGRRRRPDLRLCDGRRTGFCRSARNRD
jgi:isoquinoline 1-oxidoreductase alpha subunit